MGYVFFLASVVLLDLTSCANLKFYCVEWMEVLLLGRRVHRYIDRIKFSALLASIEAVNETSALVARLEARHETRCEEEATSTPGLKKKGGCQIEPPPQINNECIEKPLTQLKGAVMEVGYLLKCILVLIFLGLTLLVKM